MFIEGTHTANFLAERVRPDYLIQKRTFSKVPVYSQIKFTMPRVSYRVFFYLDGEL